MFFCLQLAYYHCQTNTSDQGCTTYAATLGTCAATYALDDVITCATCGNCGADAACISATAIVNAIAGSLGLSLTTVTSIIPSTASDADKAPYWKAARCFAACHNESACPFAVGYSRSPCASLSCFGGFASPSFECCAESLGLCFADFNADPYCRQPGFTSLQATCLATHFNYTGPLSTPAATTMFASTAPSTTSLAQSTTSKVITEVAPSTVSMRTANEQGSTSTLATTQAQVTTRDRGSAVTTGPQVVVLVRMDWVGSQHGGSSCWPCLLAMLLAVCTRS